MSCGICERIEQIKTNTNPHFVAELQTGYVVVGDHQLFRGYALLLHKEHKTELHELEHTNKIAFLEEMTIVAEAVYKAFKPEKLIYELLGNGMPHMHWHIFPRHSDDLRPIGPVWVIDKNIRYGDVAAPTPELRTSLKEDLLTQLHQLAPNKIVRGFI